MESYSLNPASVGSVLHNNTPVVFTVKGSNDSRHVTSVQELLGNYVSVTDIQISYWNSFSNLTTSALLISWTTITSSPSSGLSKWADITTIVAIILVSVICFLCCLLVFLRLLRLHRRRRVYTDSRIPVLSRGRNEVSRRVYSRLTSSRLTRSTIDQLLPVLVFTTDLLEVGESICTICFETCSSHRITLGTIVRKLSCKHVFHENCILNWLHERIGEPCCPMCKSNPFTEVLDRMQADGSLNASGSELQYSIGNDGPISGVINPRPDRT